MKEYKKSDVLEKLKAAFEAGVKRARLADRHGLVPGTPVRDDQGGWLLPFEDLNAAWADYWRERAAFLWVLKRYHAERGREVPPLLMTLFDTFMERFSAVFNEDDLREAFRGVVEQVEGLVEDDAQMEFNF